MILLRKPIKTKKGTLKLLRIRKPTQDRPQIGCGDFVVADYKNFKKKYLGKSNFELFKGKNFEFIGIHDMKKNYLVYFPDLTLSDELGL